MCTFIFFGLYFIFTFIHYLYCSDSGIYSPHIHFRQGCMRYRLMFRQLLVFTVWPSTRYPMLGRVVSSLWFSWYSIEGSFSLMTSLILVSGDGWAEIRWPSASRCYLHHVRLSSELPPRCYQHPFVETVESNRWQMSVTNVSIILKAAILQSSSFSFTGLEMTAFMISAACDKASIATKKALVLKSLRMFSSITGIGKS